MLLLSISYTHKKQILLCLHDVFFIVFCRQGPFEWSTVRSYTFWSGISQKR